MQFSLIFVRSSGKWDITFKIFYYIYKAYSFVLMCDVKLNGNNVTIIKY